MRLPAPIVVLLTLLLTVPLLAQDAASKARFALLSTEFKKVKKSALWEEIKKRRDLINQLGELDHPKVPGMLFEVFTKDREQVCRIPAMIGLSRVGNTKARKMLLTAAVRDKNDVFVMCLPLAFRGVEDPELGAWMLKNLIKRKKPPELRAAVVECLGHLRCSGAYEPVLEMVAEEAEKERRDVRILYEGLLALARIGKAQAWDPLLPFLEDKDRVVRQAAVRAISETGHPLAVEEVLPLAEDVCPRVQEAVAETIRRAKSEEGIPALITLLKSGRLRVMDSARNALEEITGEKHGLVPEAWEHWWKQKKAGKLPAASEPDQVGSVATYYGMKILSDRLLFVLDVSGSMNAGKPMRIETAREELGKTLDQLDQRTLVNIVAFASGPRWWREEEVKATPENLADAKEFVAKIPVGGGTNVFDTFEQAFQKNHRMDTIYFLGDGSPSLGKHTEQEEILARLRWMNRFRQVRIHTIALVRGEVGRFGGRMGPKPGRGWSRSPDRMYDEDEASLFLARMAAEHGGSHVKIEK